MTEPADTGRRKPRWDAALRTWIEDRFENWAHVSARRRWPVIGSMVALALVLGSQLPRLEIDTSTESFLREDDPARVVYQAFRQQFGSDQLIVIALRPPRLFDLGFLETLHRLHRAIEDEVPYVEEVTSLINVRETRGEGDELIVRDLLEDWPVGADALPEIRARAMANPLYRNYILSEDQRTTTLTIKLDVYSQGLDPDDSLGGFDELASGELVALTGEEEARAVAAIHALVERFRVGGLEIHLAGGQVMAAR